MKLLPPTKDFQKPITANSRKINTESFFNKKDKTVTVLLEIEKKTIKIDKLLKRSLASKLKLNEKSRIKKEEASFDKKESELEKKKPKKMKGINLPSIPSFGIFGWIKNFVFNVILGFLAVRLIKYLPMLIRLLPIISKAMDFIIDFGGKLLDGLVTFVDWGYKAYDATRGFVKNTFGEDGAKKFEDLSSKFATFMNIAIIAGMLAAGSGGGGGFGGGKTKGGAIKPRPGEGFRPKVTTTGGGGAARPDIRNPLRGRPNVTESGGLRNPLRRKPTVTGGGGRSGIRNPFRTRPNITGAIGEGAEGLAAKGASKFGAKFGGKGIPVVGPLIDFAIRTLIFHEPLGRAAAGSVGLAVGQILGGIAGSVIPVGGTIIGGIIGGLIGDMIGTSLYDFISEIGGATKLAGGGSPVEAARKGNVSGPSGRTFKKKKSKRTITPTPRKISPGGSTGGKDKIMGLFPDTQEAVTSPGIIGSTTSFIGNIINNLFGGTPDNSKDKNKKSIATKKPNPYQYLTKSAEIIGKTDFFGPLMNLGMKSNLGDKPNKTDYFLAAQGLNAWMNRTISFQGAAFAGGGEVSAQMFGQGEDYTKVIAKSIEDSVSPSVDKTQKELMRNLMIKKIEPETPAPTPGPDGEGSGEGGGGGDLETAGGAVDASQLYKGIGANAEQWDIFRNSIALIESKGKYGIAGGSGKHYDGRYQMGEDAKKDGSRVAGVPYPGHSSDPNAHVRVSFRNNPQLQETIFTGFTVANHQYLMRNLKYKAASVERKLQILGYAHNQGMGGAENWLTSGQVGSDGFGTKGTAYTDLIAKNFKAKRSGGKMEIAQGAVEVASQTGDPSQAVARLLRDFPQIRTRKNNQQIYASGLGFWMKKNFPTPGEPGRKGTGDYGDPRGGREQMEHPDHGGIVARHKGQGHNMGTALDLGGNGDSSSSPGAKDQDYMWTYIKKFMKIYGLDGKNTMPKVYNAEREKYGPSRAGSGYIEGHNNHLHVEFAKGGETPDGATRAIVGEKGKEYVIDADSYKAVEEVTPGLLDVLNYGINDKNSFKDKLPKIIETLQQYASYEDNYESEVIIIQNDQEGQNSYRPSSSGSPSISYSSGIDSKSDQFQVLNMV